jgi:hypothetical protein
MATRRWSEVAVDEQEESRQRIGGGEKRARFAGRAESRTKQKRTRMKKKNWSTPMAGQE